MPESQRDPGEHTTESASDQVSPRTGPQKNQVSPSTLASELGHGTRTVSGQNGLKRRAKAAGDLV